MTADDGMLSHLRPYYGKHQILVGDGALLPIKQISSATLHTPSKSLNFKNVLKTLN